MSADMIIKLYKEGNHEIIKSKTSQNGTLHRSAIDFYVHELDVKGLEYVGKGYLNEDQTKVVQMYRKREVVVFITYEKCGNWLYYITMSRLANN